MLSSHPIPAQALKQGPGQGVLFAFHPHDDLSHDAGRQSVVIGSEPLK